MACIAIIVITPPTRLITVKVAKKLCDSADLPLVVASYALEYTSVKVERLSKGNFEVRAWNRVTD
jgi:hypothetical protein